MNGHPKGTKVLYDDREIATRVRELGQDINQFYHAKGYPSGWATPEELTDEELPEVFNGDNSLLVVGILKGAVYFFSNLTQELDFPLAIDFMRISSYNDETSSQGDVRITADISANVQGRDVLIVEDILDSGQTLDFLIRTMRERGAKSVKTCVFIDKTCRRVVDIHADWVGLTLPENKFLFGYGMDHQQLYRELRYICYVEK